MKNEGLSRVLAGPGYSGPFSSGGDGPERLRWEGLKDRMGLVSDPDAARSLREKEDVSELV